MNSPIQSCRPAEEDPEAPEPFTMISNDLLEALSRLQASGREWQLLMAVIRKTCGYRRDMWETTNAELRNIIGTSKNRLNENLRELVARRILTEPQMGFGYKITLGLQKKYTLWKANPKRGPLANRTPNGVRTEPQIGSEVNPKRGPASSRKKKENFKESVDHQIPPDSKDSAANEVYNFYLETIHPKQHTRRRALSNISWLLKKHPRESLRQAIVNYSGTAMGYAPEYRKDPANFFGKRERYYEDYLPEHFEKATDAPKPTSPKLTTVENSHELYANA